MCGTCIFSFPLVYRALVPMQRKLQIIRRGHFFLSFLLVYTALVPMQKTQNHPAAVTFLKFSAGLQSARTNAENSNPPFFLCFYYCGSVAGSHTQETIVVIFQIGDGIAGQAIVNCYPSKIVFITAILKEPLTTGTNP